MKDRQAVNWFPGEILQAKYYNFIVYLCRDNCFQLRKTNKDQLQSVYFCFAASFISLQVYLRASSLPIHKLTVSSSAIPIKITFNSFLFCFATPIQVYVRAIVTIQIYQDFQRRMFWC